VGPGHYRRGLAVSERGQHARSVSEHSSYVGQRLKRLEDSRLVRGRGRYAVGVVAAIANAVADALAPLEPAVNRLPLTPARVQALARGVRDA